MSKHPLSGQSEADVQLTDDLDLDRDPGIKSTRGTQSAEDVDLLAGDTSVEGDTAEGTNPNGGVKVDQWGRTNS